jgi:hypothetical protein
MNARLNALATVLDVVVLVGLGLGLFFAPLTLVWAFDDGFATDLLLSWAIAVDGWMLGHGVPLTFTLDPLLAQSLSLGDTNSNFVVDVALLGVGLLTLLWGYRIGRRSGTRIYPVSTWFLAVGTLVALSFAMVFFLPAHMVSMELMDALVRPALFLAAGLALATWVGSRAPGGQVLEGVLPEGLLAVLRTGVKAGGASLVGLVGVAALSVAGLVLVSFGTMITLYESLQPGVWGIIVLSMAQLALLPTAIVWSVMWMVGPGFALGNRSLGVSLGIDSSSCPSSTDFGHYSGESPGGRHHGYRHSVGGVLHCRSRCHRHAAGREARQSVAQRSEHRDSPTTVAAHCCGLCLGRRPRRFRWFSARCDDERCCRTWPVPECWC